MLDLPMIQVTPNIAIQETEIHENFIRATGPGGQNVNKVASAVQLRFDVANSPSLPSDVRQRLIALAGRRLTADGVLVIEAKRHRTQAQNREDALQRLIALIEQAAVPPKPRIHTKPTYASKVRRLDAKRRRGSTKQSRGPVNTDDE